MLCCMCVLAGQCQAMVLPGCISTTAAVVVSAQFAAQVLMLGMSSSIQQVC